MDNLSTESVLHREMFNERTLLDEARKQADLEDFGADWFLEPMGVLSEALCSEARLSEEGFMAQRQRFISNLVNRLRMIDITKKYPEILDEKISVAAVILGLPRTGSTLLHRMLTSVPGMTAVRWWETWNYSPLPNEEIGKPEERRQIASAILDQMITNQPDLMAIHGFHIDAHDEEITILDSFFVGTVAESWMYVPTFANWLTTADQRPAYRDLQTVLKILQWQDPERAGKRWILKTPCHMLALETLLETFPDATLVMTHRDPLLTIPSLCSFAATLCRLYSNDVDPAQIGSFTETRMAGIMSRFTEGRDKLPPGRIIDIQYENLIRKPLDEGHKIFNQLGIKVTSEIENAMANWLADNTRENQAPHSYSLEDFGLTAQQIGDDFASYKKRFLGQAGIT